MNSSETIRDKCENGEFTLLEACEIALAMMRECKKQFLCMKEDGYARALQTRINIIEGAIDRQKNGINPQ